MIDTKSLLEEAARHGKLSVLHNLLSNNPAALVDFRLKSPGKSLLHEAIKCQQLSFVAELIKRDPDAVAEMDKDGFRALDIAVIMGNMRIVREILNFDKDLCLLKGKDGKTALHHAAVRGRPDMIDALLNSCPELIEDLTVHAETTLHLAVKNHQFDAFTTLIKWVERLSKESIINMADEDGNTVLHFAVFTRQYAYVDLVLPKSKGTINVNARNGDGLTALDVVDIQDSYDLNMIQKLECAGSVRSPGSHPNINARKSTKHAKNLNPNQDPDHNSEDWFDYFKFQKQRDSPSNTRNALLVVAALIATICFQAGLDPPGGKASQLSSPPPSPPPTSSPSPSPPSYFPPGVVSGLGVLIPSLSGSYPTLLIFLFANSLGLMASSCIIIYLTAGFPFQRELLIALYSMLAAYGCGVNSVLKDEKKAIKTGGFFLMTIAFSLPFVLRWLPRWVRKAWIRWSRDSMNNPSSSL